MILLKLKNSHLKLVLIKLWPPWIQIEQILSMSLVKEGICIISKDKKGLNSENVNSLNSKHHSFLYSSFSDPINVSIEMIKAAHKQYWCFLSRFTSHLIQAEQTQGT